MTPFDALMGLVSATTISADDVSLDPHLVVSPYEGVAQASSWCGAASRIGAMPAAG
jgi:hypothetical protein